MNKKMEWKRTHYCSDLRVEDVDREVVLMGWCKTRRDHGGVIFVDLRDYTGITQIVFKVEISESSHVLADTIRGEFVLAVKGKVAHRIEGNVNPKLPTGQIEVLIENLEILNQSLTPPYVLDDRENVDEKLRLTYRFLDLRDSTLQNNLMLRSKAMQIVRNYYTSQRFFEIETPILTKSTPEGARDYLVPSRVNPGLFYALPQSPQLFKQLLMISGYDRYMQIARCFRDEDLRGNRQPEFTQIDLELSFTEPEEIYELTEALMVQLFEQTIGVKVETPFPRMTYQQAMENYGSDAPDIRFELKLIDISDIAADCELRVFKQVVDKGGIVKAICVPGGAEFSRKDLDDLTEFAQIYGAKGMAWIKRNPDGWQSPIAKFFTDEQKQALEERVGLNEGDLVLFCADQKKVVYDALGNLRQEIARRRGLLNESEYRFVWVTDFPLFEYSETEKSYTSSHHPFTMPDTDDLEKYAENSPEKIRSRAYDVVLNGVEIGGGSIRIHREDIQNKVFKLLKLTEEEIESKFGFLMKALSFGAPPHGGIALGFDRLMMFLLKTNSIRDVIAFPKTQKAGCLMTDAPSAVETDQLDELHIRVKASAQQME
ncbi:MAG: aspartate--tRNA ligase [Deltaproteobacteria bacterium]|jgi:aspartyl-tRNA synthetase|nr:aspartate--tRNA ligase [Deltaproteobacteria bacterium]MDP6307987.1 aspartate--tRNA ligase [SAR324 cluster bacterium]MDP7176509.1 aspartate--tRNA ligase [SAR324 cluster bacterium]MDP7440009.1 aspartate--tRNA ligase [SAR324 cluster bacterium]MDP7581922.1 aspartate--tRNA ligase [SAR324 cluster bacterium]|tara:strand:- start:274 stop:2070 length:1797 start_codon:yes stop_codon:yes gene_type:complete